MGSLLRLRPIPKTGEVPVVVSLYDHEAEVEETIAGFFTPLEWSLIHTALCKHAQASAEHPALQPYVELAERVRETVRGRRR